MSESSKQKTRARRRDFGTTSALGQLPEPLQAQLWERCRSTARYSEIKQWLAEAHGIRTSTTALCLFYQRRKEAAANVPPVSGQVSTPGAFEIVVTAPGASEVRVQFRQLPFQA